MNCNGFEAILPDLVRDRLSEEAIRAQALGHASSCPHCARRLAEENELTELFKLAISEKEEAPHRMEAELIAAFHSRRARTMRPAYGWLPFRWPGLLPVCVALSAIAVLLALAEIEIRHWHRRPAPVTEAPGPNETRASRVPTTGNDQATQQPALEVRQALDEAPTKAAEPAILPRPQAPRKAAAPEEIATDFIALTSAANLSSMESGQLVRVQLPRSALAYYGLPFNQELADKPVSAQVLVGQDGVARAIRFLREADSRVVQTGLRSKQ